MSLVRRGWQGLRRAFLTLAGQDSPSKPAALLRKPRRTRGALRVEQLEARELLAGMPVGMNLEDLVDWSPAWVFKDVFKSSRNWVSHSYNTVTRQTDWAGGANVPVSVDDQGWPTQLATWTNSSGQRMEQRLGMLMFRELNGQYPGGTYRA